MNMERKEAIISAFSRELLERKGYKVVSEREGDSIACIFGDMGVVVDISFRIGALPPERPLKASRARELTAWAAETAFGSRKTGKVRLDSLSLALDATKEGRAFVRHTHSIKIEPDNDNSSTSLCLEDYVLSTAPRLVDEDCARHATSILEGQGYQTLFAQDNFIFAKKDEKHTLFEAISSEPLRDGDPMVSRPRMERIALEMLAKIPEIPDGPVDFGLVVLAEDGSLSEFRTGVLKQG